MKEDLIWRSGPPPHIGWFNASNFRAESIWRWWNGYYWSVPVDHEQPSHVAGKGARIKTLCDFLEWRTYYPKNARVPRIDPSRVKSHQIEPAKEKKQ